MTSFSRRRLLGLLFCSMLPLSLQAQTAPLRLNSGVGAPYFKPDKQGFIDLLVPALFRRLGVEAEGVQYAASERAMLNANEGLDDGIVLRIKGLEKSYPNLMRVGEKILDNHFVAYTLRPEITVRGFADLARYQVAYINGWKIFEGNLPPGTQATRVQNAEQLFSLLAGNRTDIVLHERWQGDHLIRELGVKARLLQPPLATTDMFIYLHKKHAHLVEPAARALRAMKSDGSYQRIVDQSLSSPRQ